MDLTLITAMGTSFLTTMATKGADAPGNTLNLAWQYTFHGMDSFFKQGLIKKESAQKFQENISKNLEEIPDENIVEPRKSIVMNALECAKNSLDEESIQEMYAKLIAAACDSRKANELHPSFVEIVKQLSPTDALLLEELRKNDKTPSAQYFTSTLDGGETNLSDVFILPLVGDYQQTVNGIDNLERLSLIKIPASRFLVDQTLYSEFETDIVKVNILTQNNTLDLKIALDEQKSLNNPARNIGLFDDIEIRKGYVGITSFGLSFIRCCIG